MCRHHWVVAAALAAALVGTSVLFGEERPNGDAEGPIEADLTGLSLLDGLDADSALTHMSFQESMPAQATPGCDCCVDACRGCCTPGWVGYAEYLNWKARRRGLDFASYLNPVWLTPLSVESLDYDRDSGFRAGVGYQFQTCWDVTWNYTYFHTDARGCAEVGDRPGVLNSTRSFLDTTFDSVWAEAELEYDVHDLEVGRRFPINGTTAMRLFGGFRWAMIDQDLTIWHTYRDIFQNGVTGRISNPTAMDGYGIRLGAEGQWTSGCGLRLFGRGAASVLVGDFHARQLERDEIEGAIVNFSEEYTQAVPVLEVALGAAWSRGPFEISGGYELSSWFNMAEVGRASYDLIFDGFFVRLAIAR